MNIATESSFLRSTNSPKPLTKQYTRAHLLFVLRKLRPMVEDMRNEAVSFLVKLALGAQTEKRGFQVERFSGEMVAQASDILLTNLVDLRKLSFEQAQKTYAEVRWFLDYAKNENLLLQSSYPTSDFLSSVVIKRKLASIQFLCESIFDD